MLLLEITGYIKLSNTMIYGISGHKQSGKNTVALIWQLLDFKYNGDYKEIVVKNYSTDEEYIKACITGMHSYLRYAYRFRFRTHSFAHKLKLIVSILTGCYMLDLEKEEFKNSELPKELQKKGIRTYRELLQKLGTEILRNNLGNNLWADILLREYSEDDSWLITDVRFPNEVEAIKSKGGKIIRLIRDNPTDAHSSETALDNFKGFDYVIDNNCSIEQLIARIKVIMEAEGII